MIQKLQCCISLVNPCAYSHAAGYFPGLITIYRVYPKKYAHGFVVLCFVVVMQSFIMNSHEVFIHIHQGCFAGTGAIVRLPQCRWSKPDGYGKISQCITTTKHSKAKNRVHTSWDILYVPSTSIPVTSEPFLFMIKFGLSYKHYSGWNSGGSTAFKTASHKEYTPQSSYQLNWNLIATPCTRWAIRNKR